MPAKPTTCVIGAGISGLTAGKAFSDWGLPYTCFEASDDVGGNWYFGNPNGRSSAYRSLHIDTYRDSVSFRDMPMGRYLPGLPAPRADPGVHQRLRRRLLPAGADPLRDPGRARRAQVARAAGRSHSAMVRSRSSTSSSSATATTGIRATRTFPGSFDGETLHSHHYLSPTEPLDLTGKRVLVVGIGNSAVDIVSELSRKGVAEKVFLSTRSGAWVMPKYLFGQPIGKLVKTNPLLPLKLQRWLAKPLPYLASGRMEDFGLPHPNHGFLEAHPTVSSELLLRLGSGDAVAKPNVDRLEGDSVRFEDGSVEQVDAIVWATGYRITFPFFDPEFISAPENRFPLYKRIFVPGIDDLAFIGFAQTVPTLFPFVELQSKLVARYVGGDYALPPVPQMEETIRRDQERQFGKVVDRPRHTMQIDWYVYEHDIWTREIPAGRERVAQGLAPKLAERVLTAEAAARARVRRAERGATRVT